MLWKAPGCPAPLDLRRQALAAGKGQEIRGRDNEGSGYALARSRNRSFGEPRVRPLIASYGSRQHGAERIGTGLHVWLGPLAP